MLAARPASTNRRGTLATRPVPTPNTGGLGPPPAKQPAPTTTKNSSAPRLAKLLQVGRQLDLDACGGAGELGGLRAVVLADLPVNEVLGRYLHPKRQSHHRSIRIGPDLADVFSVVGLGDGVAAILELPVNGWRRRVCIYTQTSMLKSSHSTYNCLGAKPTGGLQAV